MAEIIICDEFVEEVGTLIKQEGDKLDTAISTYVSILENIRADGIIEGQTAKALDAFIEEAKTLKSQFELLGSAVNLYYTNCVSKIDEADEYLY